MIYSVLVLTRDFKIQIWLFILGMEYCKLNWFILIAIFLHTKFKNTMARCSWFIIACQSKIRECFEATLTDSNHFTYLFTFCCFSLPKTSIGTGKTKQNVNNTISYYISSIYKRCVGNQWTRSTWNFNRGNRVARSILHDLGSDIGTLFLVDYTSIHTHHQIWCMFYKYMSIQLHNCPSRPSSFISCISLSYWSPRTEQSSINISG